MNLNNLVEILSISKLFYLTSIIRFAIQLIEKKTWILQKWLKLIA
jgi:hypothetical protein